MRRLNICTLVLVLTAMGVLPHSSPAQAIEEVQSAIDVGNEGYMAAMANADARAFAAIFDTDGSRLSGGGDVVRGRHAITNQMGEFFTRVGPISATLETADLWVVDSLAYETGIWSYTFTPPGDTRRTIGGRYVTLWKRQVDDQWKIFAELGVPGTER
ncbi:MAG: SgcJ/EcaC family oxidoreductase [Rhodothermales bacterium]|nr:SgcJ/EcaC family oxidoreductase [Rhodothermales bacterium]